MCPKQRPTRTECALVALFMLVPLALQPMRAQKTMIQVDVSDTPSHVRAPFPAIWLHRVESEHTVNSSCNLCLTLSMPSNSTGDARNCQVAIAGTQIPWTLDRPNVWIRCNQTEPCLLLTATIVFVPLPTLLVWVGLGLVMILGCCVVVVFTAIFDQVKH